MENTSIEKLEKEFDEIKIKFSKWSSRGSTLIKEMQDNLKQRTKETSIVMLDNQTYSLDSENPSDLFAIDSALKSTRKRTDNEEDTIRTREKMLDKNKYGPNHPYLDK